MEARVGNLFRNIGRYLFAFAIVAGAFALRWWLIPFTGTGAPFVLFFAAVLVTSLYAGVWPGICALVISLPLAVDTFVTRAGYPLSQAVIQALLFGVDGLVVVYLTFLMRRERQAVQDANRQLHTANEEITRSMARSRELIELAPDAFFQADLDARFTDVNQAACRLLRYSWDELIGKTIFDFVPVEDADRLKAVRAELLLPGRVHTAEWILKRKDGTFVPVEVSSNILPDGRWQAFVRDISERKRAEDELRISEAKFSGIVSISADAIVAVDGHQRIVIFNDGAEKIFGYSKAEVIGAPLDILIPGRLRAAHRLHVEQFISGKETARQMGEQLTTLAGLRKNGEEFPAEAAISKLGVGETALLTVALRDVTDRKRIEKEERFLTDAVAVLARSLDFEQTLATVAQLVVRDFADWCLVELVGEHEHIPRLKMACADPANAALCTRFEQVPIDRNRPYLVREVIEKKQSLLIEHVTSEHLEAVAQNPEHLQVLRSINPTSLMALPLLIRGQLLGVIAFVSSTPSRTYRPRDLRLAEALADRAALAIQNARLYRASVHATQLRDQVLGVVAHDLRNPLAAILLQANALKRRGPEPERRSQQRSEGIERAARRMNRLIQDLLDVARMESGQLTLTRTRLSARELIVGAADMQRPLASASSLELGVDATRDVPDVWGDRDRLLQVFANLIGNAIRFTGAGGRITVGATSRDHDVVFWVADTGSGIASENLPRVFDRFWQATRSGREGAGLGLPITKGIVEAHGGRIWVESTPNRGTTFSFTIPEATPEQGRPSGPSGSSHLEGYRAA